MAISAVVMVLAAAVFGIMELYAIAAAATVLLGGALAWTQLGRWRVVTDRQLHSLRAGVGDDVVVGVRLTNDSRYRSPAMRLRDPVELGAGSVDLAVGPIAPGGSVRGSYRLRARERGVFRLGPLSMHSTDPFGLAQRVRTAPKVSTVIVHPRVEPLRFATASAGLDRRTVGRVPAIGHDNDEFSSLREYRPGDDLRRLHWASTARADTLMVREDQIQHRGQLTVFVDLRATTWTPSSLERGLSAAASVALANLDAGLAVRLVTTAGTDTGTGSGSEHGARILDDLAAAEVHGSTRSPAAGGSLRHANDLVRGDSHHGPRYATPKAGGHTERPTGGDGADALVVVGGEATPATLASSNGVARNAPVVHLVIEGTAGGARPSGRPQGQVVRVGSKGLAAAWAQAST